MKSHVILYMPKKKTHKHKATHISSSSKVQWRSLINNRKNVVGICKISKGGSLGPHRHAAETYYVISGSAMMTLNNSKPFTIKKGSVIKTPRNTVHFTKNTNKKPLIFVYKFNTGPMSKIEYSH